MSQEHAGNNPISKNNGFIRPQTPIMGWSSWNNFRIEINEDLIKAQADAMVATGMKSAGYQYINIDDGYFGGRDEEGKLLTHSKKFPSGMRSLSDYIHAKGLRAGIYTDAGANTCGSHWDQDRHGAGVGLYGHDRQDLHLMLREWNYDFIKVDWCGGQWLGLDEQIRYTEIGRIVREIRPEVVYNICRWQFPGKWACLEADSWRISGDIANNFGSILKIIDLNADLWRFASPGHVNDMDMLQVGRGMHYEEDKAHFTMWCMMNSPLLAGNDLTKMSAETLDILTNSEIIALNQDRLVYQARRIQQQNELEVWAKPLVSTISGQVAIALLNRSESQQTISFELQRVGIDASKGYQMRDLWLKHDYPHSTAETAQFDVAPHAVVALRVAGVSLPYTLFQFQDQPKGVASFS